MTDDEFKALFAEAFSLKKANKFVQARDVLKPLAAKRPAYASVRGVLAGVLFELGEYGEAASEFREVTRLSPRSELASLGLFHSLLEIGDRTGAVAEMRRFTGLRESAEYALLRSEFQAELGDEQ